MYVKLIACENRDSKRIRWLWTNWFTLRAALIKQSYVHWVIIGLSRFVWTRHILMTSSLFWLRQCALISTWLLRKINGFSLSSFFNCFQKFSWSASTWGCLKVMKMKNLLTRKWKASDGYLRLIPFLYYLHTTFLSILSCHLFILKYNHIFSWAVFFF
jgi:hypothetical protein